MAKVVVTEDQNFHAIAKLAGSSREALSYHPDTNELDVPDVTKKDLDKALADYEADRATIDSDFEVAEADAEMAREEAKFNQTKPLKAVVEFLVEQINELRAAQSLPPVAFDFRSAIKKVK